ncbi:hypothetical protein B566_EDAN004960 [Ephemera danica]|nr:hypothetical protein B566_EDAN004960 [Ephemera danica]
MLDTFKMEFRRVTDVNKSEGSVDHQLSSMSDSELQRRILDWKFSSLDQNRDQQLEKHEYRGLRRLVRRIIMPRRCAKTFTRTCDADQNEIISREEWNDCLGLDFNMLTPALIPTSHGTSSFEDDLSQQVSRGPSASEDDTNEGYCFCVDEDTGKVLPGTSVKDGDPRCDSIIPPPRPMKAGPSATTANPKRTGKNPIEELLKPEN